MKSQQNGIELVTRPAMAQVRAGIKAERKQYVSVRPSNLTVQNNPATPANATQVWSLTQSVFFVLVENSLLQDGKSIAVILVRRIQFNYVYATPQSRESAEIH